MNLPPLTETDLAEIRRQSTLTQLALSRRFGVSPGCIDAIVRGRPWRALAEPTPDLFEQKGGTLDALSHSLCRRPL